MNTPAPHIRHLTPRHIPLAAFTRAPGRALAAAQLADAHLIVGHPEATAPTTWAATATGHPAEAFTAPPAL